MKLPLFVKDTFINRIMIGKKLTQEEAEQQSLDVGIKMIGKYLGNHIQTTFQCPRCPKIFLSMPNSVWGKHTKSCGCLRKEIASNSHKNPMIKAKMVTSRKIPKKGNSLAEKFPEIAKEWHPVKNNKTPFDINYGSHDKVWWKCKLNHEYLMVVCDKVGKHLFCPICSGYQILLGFNDLKSQYSYLCQEWDYVKNNKSPENYTRGSHKKVWWKCKKCNNSWRCIISDRTRSTNNTGCPQCHKSKGEQEIQDVLNKYNIKYIKEKTFKNLIGLGNGLLRFDFYLLEHNTLIEYQGQQHYNNIKKYHITYNFNILKQHDQLKRKYCRDNNIKLIEIKYTDFNHIANILQKELNLNKENK